MDAAPQRAAAHGASIGWGRAGPHARSGASQRTSKHTNGRRLGRVAAAIASRVAHTANALARRHGRGNRRSRKKSLSHPAGRAPLTSSAHGQQRWLHRNGNLPLLAQPAGRQGADVQSSADAGRIHWPQTLIRKGPQPLQRQHIRRVQPPVQAAHFHLIVLDNSGSMRHGGRLGLTKAYAARLVDDATRAGDQVAIMHFGGQGVQVLKAPGPARRAAIARIQALGGGGGTPIASCMQAAQALLHHYRMRHGHSQRTLWLLTDGRSLEQPPAPMGAERIVIVNFDDPLRPLGRCAAWAHSWGAELRSPLQPG